MNWPRTSCVGRPSDRCYLTLQAISEFFAVATRKNMVPPSEAAGIAEAMIDLFPTIAASAAAVRTALTTAASGRASYWDALLVNTAAEAGCTAILTEDLPTARCSPASASSIHSPAPRCLLPPRLC